MNLRKFGALFLALVLTLSLCTVPAAAAGSDFEIEGNVLLYYVGPGGAVTIPDGITRIGTEAFLDCKELTSVTIPNSVTEIIFCAFSGCTGLTSITIPDSVSYIGDSVFSDCTGLKSVTILDGVTAIGYTAFSGCTGLTNITIPGSVSYIGSGAFEDTPWLKSLGDLAIVNHILLAYQGAGGAVTIPAGVTAIGPGAFSGCTGLTSVTIPDTVTKIGVGVFSDCTGLKSVTIPAGITEISDAAFAGTPWLESLGDLAIANNILLKYQGAGGAVTIPDGVTTISNHAFEDCSEPTGVVVPDSVTKIGDSAFYDCPNLTLYGGAGSHAQTYAKENDIPFVVGKVAIAPAPPTAIAAPQIVLVDGKEVKFDAYALKDEAGNMTNYFKVRDVASVLSGTAAQFSVGWENQVVLQTKTAYTPNGSEMTTPFAGDQPYTQDRGVTAVDNDSPYLDYITLTDAKGNGYTYYKLRDLGNALGFKVDWNGKNVTISTAP